MINVKELTDTELNRAMIWLCGDQLPSYIGNPEVEDDGKLIEVDYGEATYDINYLSEWNLTMPLAVENNLRIQFHTPTVVSSFDMTMEADNKNPLRAICEVLVQIKLEQNHGN